MWNVPPNVDVTHFHGPVRCHTSFTWLYSHLKRCFCCLLSQDVLSFNDQSVMSPTLQILTFEELVFPKIDCHLRAGLWCHIYKTLSSEMLLVKSHSSGWACFHLRDLMTSHKPFFFLQDIRIPELMAWTSYMCLDCTVIIEMISWESDL